MYKILCLDDKALVRLRDEEKVQQFQKPFKEKRSILHDVYCVFEILKVRFKKTDDASVQNLILNKWNLNHYFANILFFTSNGRIISGALNTPGAFYNTSIAQLDGI